MESPKISVIVPVHNAGELFFTCLDSLVNQTLKEIEIILILDCPTDGNDKVAQKYASKHPQIVLLTNPENLHIGETRNRGIDIAKGEYLAFSDHDDYLEPQMYERLYQQTIDEQPDIVMSLETNVDRTTNKSITYPFPNVADVKQEILEDLICLGKDPLAYSSLFVYIHPNIYKKSFLEKHRLRFVDTKKMAVEDLIFQIESIYHSRKVVFLKEALYRHYLHPESVGHSYSYKSYNKRIDSIDYIYRFLKDNDITKLEGFYSLVRKITFSVLIATIKHKHSISEFRKAIGIMRNYPYYESAFKNYKVTFTPNSPHKYIIKRIIKRSLTR